MNLYCATGWLRSACDPRVAPSGRRVARWTYEAYDRTGEGHKHLCEMWTGNGALDVADSAFDKWLPMLTAGRVAVLQAELLRKSYSRHGVVKGEYTVLRVLHLEFPDRSRHESDTSTAAAGEKTPAGPPPPPDDAPLSTLLEKWENEKTTTI